MTANYEEIVRNFYTRVFEGGDFDYMDENMAPDFKEHEEFPPGFPEGIEGVKALIKEFRTGFPDLKANIEDIFTSGDKVTVRATLTGTHTGAFMNIPASGKQINVSVIDILRFEGEKAAEHWGITDNMAMMTQIGVIPEPEQ